MRLLLWSMVTFVIMLSDHACNTVYHVETQPAKFCR